MESIYSAKIYKYANVEMWQQLKHRSLMGHSRTKSLYCRMLHTREFTSLHSLVSREGYVLGPSILLPILILTSGQGTQWTRAHDDITVTMISLCALDYGLPATTGDSR